MKGTGAAILSAIQAEGKAGSKAQPLINAAIKAGDKTAFVAAAAGLERMRDKDQRKTYFSILRIRMRRGCKANDLPVVWGLKKGAEGVYSVTEKAPGKADESAKLRKALDLVKAHITDPEVSTELLSALMPKVSGKEVPQHAEAAH